MKKLSYLIVALMLSFVAACSDDDNGGDSGLKDGPKPEMDIAVSPESDLKFGDFIYVSGLMSDTRNLEHYEVVLMNTAGDTLASKYQMLLGQEFTCNDRIQIPFIRGGETQDMKVSVALDNTRNGEEKQEFDISNVSAPEFTTLYVVLADGRTGELVRNGDIWQLPEEMVFPAGIKGVISTTTTGGGIWWGTKNGEITAMAKDSITFGGDRESSFTVAFNPNTFELTEGEHHYWSPLDAADCYYILGTISGHWRDGEITTERAKMRLNGFESNNDRYYTWTAPEGDDPETGMWGWTAAGTFRLKKGGTGKYILWDGNKIVESDTDDRNMAFPLTAAGPFTMRANFSGGKCTSISVSGGGKSVTFKDGEVTVNGTVMPASIDFSGHSLQRKAGTSYVYEGTVELEKGQTISSMFDLSYFDGNSDLFNGVGNPTWTLRSADDTYTVRLDPFSGSIYACPTGGYPEFVYLDGWGIGPNSSASITWSAANVIPLVRNGTKYEATFYDFGWGGDVKFYLTWPGSGKSVVLPSSNFGGCAYVNAGGGDGSFKVPSGTGFYKVVIDLKDGVVVGADGSVSNKGSQKFTLDYVE